MEKTCESFENEIISKIEPFIKLYNESYKILKEGKEITEFMKTYKNRFERIKESYSKAAKLYSESLKKKPSQKIAEELSETKDNYMDAIEKYNAKSHI